MKYGLNMLLWTTDVTEAHYPLLDQIKKWGYDGVELPIFDLDVGKFKSLGAKLDATGLGPTADEWKWGKETLTQAADYAKQEGVTLVLEYLNRFECYFVTSAADAARFI